MYRQGNQMRLCTDEEQTVARRPMTGEPISPARLAQVAAIIVFTTAAIVVACSTGGGVSVLADAGGAGLSIAVNPPAAEITEGDSVVAFITTLHSEGAWSGDVVLSTTGMPVGGFGYIPDSPVFLPANGTVEIQDWVKPGCLAAQHAGGTYQVTFTATGSGLTAREASATLVVTNNAAC